MQTHDLINRTIFKFFRDLAVVAVMEVALVISTGDFDGRTLLAAAALAVYRVCRDVAPAYIRERNSE